MSSTPDAGFIPEIEQRLLGTLLSGGGLARIRSVIGTRHFLEPVHGGIFETILLAFERQGSTRLEVVAPLLAPDLVQAIQSRIDRPARQYLAHLVAETPHTVAHVEVAARAVVDQWARIEGQGVVERGLDAFRDPAADPTNVARLIGSGLEEILSDVRSASRGRTRMTIGEAGAEALDAAEAAMRTGGGLTGVPWGPLSDIDRLTGGMPRKSLILVGARPSMGKTTLLVSTALGAARKGHGVGILSLEMAKTDVTARALSDLTSASEAPIAYTDILRGRLDASQMLLLREKNEILRRYPIEIDDGPVGTFDIRAKIEGMAERFHRANWPRLETLMIDHLGFIQASAHYRGNRNNEVGEMTRTLKEYAKEYDIALVLLSQLSREVEKRDDKRPTLSDLRDSGNIEQDADLVAFLYRPAYYLDRERFEGDKEIERQERLEACRNKLEFILAKARNGRVGTIDLYADMALSTVRNGDRYRP